MSSSDRSPALLVQNLGFNKILSPVMRMLERVRAHSNLKIRPENEGALRPAFLRSRQLICLAAWSSSDLAGVRNLLILDVFGP